MNLNLSLDCRQRVPRQIAVVGRQFDDRSIGDEGPARFERLDDIGDVHLFEVAVVDISVGARVARAVSINMVSVGRAGCREEKAPGQQVQPIVHRAGS